MAMEFLQMTIFLHKPDQYRNSREDTFSQNEQAFLTTAEREVNFMRSQTMRSN